MQVCVDLSKRYKSIKLIYLYLSERLHHALSENNMFYKKGLSNSSGDIEDLNIKKSADLKKFNKFINFKMLISFKL